MKEKTLHSLVLCLATIAVLLLTGCNTDLTDFESTTSVGQAQVTTTSSLRTENEAMATALAMRQSFGGITRGSATCEIGDVYAWRSCDILSGKAVTRGNSQQTNTSSTDTLMYIVNFKDNNGYALVAADKGSGESILALVEKGHLTPDDDIADSGFKLFINRIAAKLSMPPTTNLPDSIIGGGWPRIPNDSMGIDLPVYDFTLVEELQPMLQTEWNHKASPFNDKCPLINGQHADAGSEAIAIAQLCAYYQYYHYKYPDHFEDLLDASAEPLTEEGKEKVADWVYEIANGIDTDFDLDHSTASFNDVKYHLEYYAYYGYSNNEVYSFERCKEALNSYGPIFVNGLDSQQNKRYSWVIDGYKITRNVEPIMIDFGLYIYPIVYRNFVHCNWGEGANNTNGYFLDMAFKPYGTAHPNYSEDLKVLYDIYYHGIPTGSNSF